ncbi:MAG TPA: DUF58 domain-containing protein [Oligoflexia bacterium]|nr:DUF58 domain-containing protein [Oligoflexia bacterium]HMP49403.1 DUF58 domain-containing protein [Oligoflexia bacterium]
MNKLKKGLQLFLHIVPLTIRGILALIFSSLLIFYFAREYSDLIAAVLGGALFFLLVFCLVTLLISAPRLKNRLKVTNNDSNSNFISHSRNKTGFSLESFTIPSLFHISISRIFDNSEIIHDTHVLTGNFSLFGNTQTSRNIFMDTIKFPHRGEFISEGFLIKYGDVFGLTKRTWITSPPFSYRVSPPSIDTTPLNIMAASSQIGDTESSNDNKSGDLFDLRAYRPGDSLKRVLWKVFARSGELIVREPEPAIVPEGEVSIYIPALLHEDEVASAALTYMKFLESQNIILSASFPGMEEKTARSITTAENLCIDSASLLCKCKSKEEMLQMINLKSFIETFKNKNSKPERIVVFCSEAESSTLITQLCSVADKEGISLGFALVPKHDFEDKTLSSRLRLSLFRLNKPQIKQGLNTLPPNSLHEIEKVQIQSGYI